MANRFSDHVVLVTGGGSGIGLACSRRFAEEGAKVFVAQRSLSDEFVTIQVDLSQPEAAKQAIDAVIAQAGKLNVLVNNAGTISPIGHLDTFDSDAFAQTFDVNVVGVHRMIKAALPKLEASKGAIVSE